MPKPLHNLADAYSPIQRAEWARENVRIALANVRESLDVLYARLDDAEGAEIRAEQPDADTEAYVEAYVEVADAERDALRDEYVNSADVEAEQDAEIPALSYGFVGAWDDPTIHHAVRETIAESEA